MLWSIILLLGILTIGLIGLGVRFIVGERSKANTQADSLTFTPVIPASTADTINPERPQAEQPPTLSGSGCLLGFATFWNGITLVIVVVMVYGFISEWREYQLLKASGVVTEAVIIDRRIDYGSADDDDDYYVTYQYTAPLPQGDSQRFTKEASVGSSTYQTLPPEKRVPILYAPSDPSLSQLQQEFGTPVWTFGFAACFVSIFVVIGVGLLYGALSMSYKAVALIMRGQITQGIVTDRWADTDSDGAKTYCIAYRFETPRFGSGPITKGEQGHKAYNAYQIGDAVRVRYLPGKPEVCRLEV